MNMFTRTHTCGALRPEHQGQRVRLAGWVRRVRDLGALAFLDLRDRYGRTQVVFEDENLAERARQLGREFFVGIEGSVRLRPEKDRNPEMATGDVEVVASSLLVLNESRVPPFLVEEETDASEELRLRYRFLDLRRPNMLRNLEIRSRAAQLVRQFLSSKGFLEIETPVLARSTPEGARDFVVPSRLQPGKFYALPQSPQLYKQVLMASGVDRYFQLARCLRDEDLRADRQPEHTQIDLEMTLATPEQIFSITEWFGGAVFKELAGIDLAPPFARISYRDAMSRFGSDKPDTRFPMEIEELTEIYGNKGFKVVDSVLESGGVVLGLRVETALSRKQIDQYTDFVKNLGSPGLLWTRAGSSGPLSRFTPEGFLRENETLLVLAGPENPTREIAGALRIRLGHDLGLIQEGSHAALWVVDFPVFQWNAQEKRLEPMHHIFTMPKAEDLHLLDRVETEPETVAPKLRGMLFDLVVDGVELGSGSVRCHDPRLQRKLMRIAGLDPANFEFLLRAMEYGAPPHGGIALGFDRIVALLVGSQNIRDVIAFPKTTSGSGLMEDSPSRLDSAQLHELGIQVREPAKPEPEVPSENAE